MPLLKMYEQKKNNTDVPFEDDPEVGSAVDDFDIACNKFLVQRVSLSLMLFFIFNLLINLAGQSWGMGTICTR